MKIELNGQPMDVQADANLADAVAATGADPGQRGIAVAVDGEVVPRSEWQTTTIREGQMVEVLQAVQGG